MFDLSDVTETYKKAAKALTKAVRSADPAAIARARAVYRDLAASESVVTAFGLMRAQHVVAVEHGFTSWANLIAASSIEQRVALTMSRHPELNDFGIGIFGEHRRLSAEEQRAINGISLDINGGL